MPTFWSNYGQTPGGAQKVSPVIATLEEVPEGVLLRHQAYEGKDLGAIAHILPGLEWPLVVLGPREVRTEMQKLAARAARIAASQLGATPATEDVL